MWRQDCSKMRRSQTGLNVQTSFGDKIASGNEEGAKKDLVPWHAHAHVKGTIGRTTDPQILTKTVNADGVEADLVL
jgi:hypothetical protein